MSDAVIAQTPQKSATQSSPQFQVGVHLSRAKPDSGEPDMGAIARETADTIAGNIEQPVMTPTRSSFLAKWQPVSGATTDDAAVRQELINASQLMRSRHNRIVSADKIVKELGLTEKTELALKDAFPRPELYGATFKFDVREFDATLLFRSVELDNGAMLIADNNKFDEVFHPKPAGRNSTSTRFTTEGRVVSTKLRKTK